jgi:small-conductance mechanosensitive channel
MIVPSLRAALLKLDRVAGANHAVRKAVKALGSFVSSAKLKYGDMEFGFDLGPVIASAGIIGVAIGLGAQSLVKDVLSGIFMLVEDQYGVGDQVKVGDVEGLVEKVGLRTTTVRDESGTLWFLRNGEILVVGNKSKKQRS